MRRQMAPALLLVPFLRICKSGPAAELMTLSISPATKSSTIKKIAPVDTPIKTQIIMIFGPCREGFGISMAISIAPSICIKFNTFNHMGNAILRTLAAYKIVSQYTYITSNSESSLKELFCVRKIIVHL